MAFTVPTTFAELQQRAESGETNLYVALGVATYFGRYKDETFTPNPEQALHWWHQAALRGEEEGLQYTHAVCTYANPPQPSTHLEQLITALEQASDQGNLDARCSLADAYREGWGKPKDPKLAFDLVQEGVAKQHPLSLSTAGSFYDLGKGAEQDPLKAVKLYQQAAELGDAFGMYSLGYCYQHGQGVTPHVTKTITFYQQAVELGNTDAMVILGAFYQNGLVVEKNLAKSLVFFKQAADLGSTNGMIILGVWYKNGLGVEKNIAKSTTLFKQAAELGDGNARLMLGAIYEEGLGVKKDIAKAFAWYQKAAELGNEQAQAKLNDFNTPITFEQKDTGLHLTVQELHAQTGEHQQELEVIKGLLKKYEDRFAQWDEKGTGKDLSDKYKDLATDFNTESGKWLNRMVWCYRVLCVLVLIGSIEFMVSYAHGFGAHKFLGYFGDIEAYNPTALGSPMITIATLFITKVSFLALPTVAALFCSRQYARAKHGKIIHNNKAANLGSMALLAGMPSLSPETKELIYLKAYDYCLTMEATGFVKDSGPVDNLDSSEATIRLLEQLKGLINK